MFFGRHGRANLVCISGWLDEKVAGVREVVEGQSLLLLWTYRVVTFAAEALHPMSLKICLAAL